MRGCEMSAPHMKPTVSSSQLKTASRCMRRWGFQKIENLPDPAGVGAIVGSHMHTDLERYFRRGTLSHPSTAHHKRGRRLAKAMIEFYSDWLPEELAVEGEFFVEQPRYRSHGFIDLVYRLEGLLYVHDHKSSADPVKYGLTPTTLVTDEQGIMYANAAFQRYPDENELALNWTYVNSKGTPEPFNVRAFVNRQDTQQRYDELIHPRANALVDARESVQRAVELEPNTDACGDFGKPCPFIDHCPRPKQTLRDKMRKSRNTERSKILQEKPDVSNAALLKNLKNRKKQSEPKAKPKSNVTDISERKTKKIEETKKKNTERVAKGKRKIDALKGKMAQKKSGLDPDKVRAAYAEQELVEDPEPAKGSPNAPEVDRGDDERLVEASKKAKAAGGDKDASHRVAEEEAADQDEKEPPRDGKQVMTAVTDAGGEEVVFSVHRSNTASPYVQKKTLEDLKSQELITYYVAGQSAYVRLPDATKRHGEVWLRCLEMALLHVDREHTVQLADELLDAYRERFG